MATNKNFLNYAYDESVGSSSGYDARKEFDKFLVELENLKDLPKYVTENNIYTDLLNIKNEMEEDKKELDSSMDELLKTRNFYYADLVIAYFAYFCIHNISEEFAKLSAAKTIIDSFNDNSANGIGTVIDSIIKIMEMHNFSNGNIDISKITLTEDIKKVRNFFNDIKSVCGFPNATVTDEGIITNQEINIDIINSSIGKGYIFDKDNNDFENLTSFKLKFESDIDINIADGSSEKPFFITDIDLYSRSLKKEEFSYKYFILGKDNMLYPNTIRNLDGNYYKLYNFSNNENSIAISGNVKNLIIDSYTNNIEFQNRASLPLNIKNLYILNKQSTLNIKINNDIEIIRDSFSINLGSYNSTKINIVLTSKSNNSVKITKSSDEKFLNIEVIEASENGVFIIDTLKNDSSIITEITDNLLVLNLKTGSSSFKNIFSSNHQNGSYIEKNTKIINDEIFSLDASKSTKTKKIFNSLNSESEITHICTLESDGNKNISFSLNKTKYSDTSILILEQNGSISAQDNNETFKSIISSVNEKYYILSLLADILKYEALDEADYTNLEMAAKKFRVNMKQIIEELNDSKQAIYNNIKVFNELFSTVFSAVSESSLYKEESFDLNSSSIMNIYNYMNMISSYINTDEQTDAVNYEDSLSNYILIVSIDSANVISSIINNITLLNNTISVYISFHSGLSDASLGIRNLLMSLEDVLTNNTLIQSVSLKSYSSYNNSSYFRKIGTFELSEFYIYFELGKRLLLGNDDILNLSYSSAASLFDKFLKLKMIDGFKINIIDDEVTFNKENIFVDANSGHENVDPRIAVAFPELEPLTKMNLSKFFDSETDVLKTDSETRNIFFYYFVKCFFSNKTLATSKLNEFYNLISDNNRKTFKTLIFYKYFKEFISKLSLVDAEANIIVNNARDLLEQINKDSSNMINEFDKFINIWKFKFDNKNNENIVTRIKNVVDKQENGANDKETYNEQIVDFLISTGGEIWKI